ncbi:MAG: GHKL domain-containing protein, partial [Clostridiales bacterium]|nr:GHKL domain-containing protein [Clostridiales bacterium]
TNIVPMLLYSLVYGGKLYKKIFYTVSVYSLGMILEDYLFLIIDFLSNGSEFHTAVIFYVVFNLLYYGIYLLLSKIISNLSGADFRFKHMFPLLFVPVCIIFFTQIFASSSFTINKFVIFAFMLVISLLIFYCFREIDRSYANIYNEQMLENENRYYKNQFDIIRDSDIRTRKLRHDYKNHMLALKSYISSGNREEAVKYIDDILGNTDFEKQIANSGNIVVDSLINYKLRDYRENSINLDLNIFIPEKLFVSSYDLNIILGNMIDNALRAALKTAERKITITVKFTDKALFIKVGNTFDGHISDKDGVLLTTKKDKKNHGFGVDIIKETIKKYDGEMDISAEDNFFWSTIILHNR